MKKYILIAATVVLTFTSCKDNQKNEVFMQQKNDSLLSVITERETAVSDFITSFNEVEQNLSLVATKQHIILTNSDKTGDLSPNQKVRINTEIKLINELMEANTKKLQQLNSKLNRSDKKNIHLQKTIELLDKQLNDKYKELTDLNNKLSALSAQVERFEIITAILSDENALLNKQIEDETLTLHTAYYVVGHSNELQKCNLIDKTGGLLGIGRTSKLNESIDNSLFTKIDYTETTSIPINSKSMKIVTTHPAESYSLDKTGKMINSILISDPEKFWSASKYLVITN